MNDKEIVVSVVVMTYYHEEYIRKALDTIIEQKTDFRYEIIIADDNSQDGTQKIIMEYTEKFPKLIRAKINTENLGISRNEYNAFLMCKGRYIVLTAGDDRWSDKHKLQKQVDFLNKHEEFIAHCDLLESVYADGTKLGVSLDKRYWNKEIKREDFLRGHFYPTGGMMIRNIFENAETCDKFSLIPRFSRDIDDLSLCLFIYDYGRVFISDNISYECTVRRKIDENQHNFNTKYKGSPNAVEHIKLISKLYKYYKKKSDFSYLYQPYLGEILYYSIKKGEKGLLHYVFMMPIVYNIKCLFRISLHR